MTDICVNESTHHWFKWWLSSVRHQAISWTNAGAYWVLVNKFQWQNWNQTQLCLRKDLHLKIRSAKTRHFCHTLMHQTHMITIFLLLYTREIGIIVRLRNRSVWNDVRKLELDSWKCVFTRGEWRKIEKRNASIMHVSRNVHCIHSLVAIVLTSDEKDLKIAVREGQYVMLLFKGYLSKLP